MSPGLSPDDDAIDLFFFVDASWCIPYIHIMNPARRSDLSINKSPDSGLRTAAAVCCCCWLICCSAVWFRLVINGMPWTDCCCCLLLLLCCVVAWNCCCLLLLSCSLQEVEVLTLYKSIVEDGPDLFSLHNPTSDAPFRWGTWATGKDLLVILFLHQCNAVSCIHPPRIYIHHAHPTRAAEGIQVYSMIKRIRPSILSSW